MRTRDTSRDSERGYQQTPRRAGRHTRRFDPDDMRRDDQRLSESDRPTNGYEREGRDNRDSVGWDRDDMTRYGRPEWQGDGADEHHFPMRDREPNGASYGSNYGSARDQNAEQYDQYERFGDPGPWDGGGARRRNRMADDENRRQSWEYERGGRADYGRADYGRTDYGSPRYGSSSYGGSTYGGPIHRDRESTDYGRGMSPWSRDPRSGDPRYDDYRDLRDEANGRDWMRSGSRSTGLFAGKGPKGWARSDDRLTDDVSEALARHPAIDASDIEVKVSSGEVTLSGTVTERSHKRMAEDIAEGIFGVSDVQNQIRVKRDNGRDDDRDSDRTPSASRGAKGKPTPTRNQTTDGSE